MKTEPQVFDLLHLLVSNAGVLISRDRIVDEIWGGRIVSESTISARTNAVRVAVGDNGKDQAIVKTVPRRGLQLVVAVSLEGGPDAIETAAHSERQRVRFAEAVDGTKIAYATSSTGPTVLRAGHFLTHLEMDWKSCIWRPYLDAWGADHTVVRYDQRGTGLSGLSLSHFDLESHVEDLAAVADATGLDRFPIIALSQGVPTAIRFAAENPDRVSCLVLYGGYAQGRAIRDGGQSSDAADAMMTKMIEGWGKAESAFMTAFTSLFCPGASQEELADLVQMQFASTSPENANLIRMAIDRFNVADLLGSVKAPTLVIHSKNDTVHPLSGGRNLASSIAGAELVVLESSNHILVPSEPAWSDCMTETLEFLERVQNL